MLCNLASDCQAMVAQIFVEAGKLAGMLSVNGYSGQAWYRTWHGDFIQTKDVGA